MSPAAGITSSETSITTTATLASQPQTNQLQISGMTYDADGRVTQDNLGNTFTYDAEGRMIAGGGYSYAYDGTGNRVAKWNGSTGRLYWPDLKGRPINETDLSGLNPTRNVYFKGKQLARQDASGNWTYNLRDHLGSTRMILDGSGNVLYQSDYYPFGGTAYTAGSTTNLYGFTGYEADTETSSNYAIFRNQAPILGRFLSPDPYRGSYHLDNPQSLNRYSYVSNKPVRHTDAFGLDDDGDTGGGTDNNDSGNDDGCSVDACVSADPLDNDMQLEDVDYIVTLLHADNDPNFSVTVTADANDDNVDLINELAKGVVADSGLYVMTEQQRSSTCRLLSAGAMVNGGIATAFPPAAIPAGIEGAGMLYYCVF